MTNEIGRKITSITLMTIMLAGGMTIAFPGFTPDAYAANANLIVSAENTGYVDGAQIVEILVIDDDLTHPDASPDVTVNGDAVAMTATSDGNWYAYIADTDSVATVDHNPNADTPVNSGIDFGSTVAEFTADTTEGCGITSNDSGATHVYCGAAAGDDAVMVPAAPKTADADGVTWPFVQTYPFSSIEIHYNKAGGTQITSLEFDENADGLSLDRDNYPQGAQVHATIGDHRLNIDPTRADVWTWNMTSGDKYYSAAAVVAVNTDDPGDQITAGTQTSQVCAGCIIDIDFGGQGSDAIIELAEVDNRELPYPTIVEQVEFSAAVGDDPDTDVNEERAQVDAVSAEAWFTVREVGGPNSAVFAATNLADESILTVSDTAARDSAAYITYDGDTTDILVKHSEATIEIQSPDDVWTSGLAIPIVVVDGDVNKNSRADDDLSVSDINSIVPTLVTGDPFTLSEISDEIIIWIGVNLVTASGSDVEREYSRLIESADAPVSGSDLLNYTHGYTAGFRLGGINNDTGMWQEDEPFSPAIRQHIGELLVRTGWTPPGDFPDPDDRIGIRSETTVEEFSNRGIVSLPNIAETFTQAERTSLGKLLDTDDFETIPASILAFDIGDSAHELLDTLIDTRPWFGRNRL